MRRGEWLRPPGPLLAWIGATTVVSLAGLLWMGWRVLANERAAALQDRRQQVEEGADRLAAELKGELALTQVKLASWTQTPPKDADIPAGQLLLLDSGPPRVIPSSRLLYAPFRQGLPDVGLAFQKAEALEFQENRMRAAASDKAALTVVRPPADTLAVRKWSTV